MKPSKGKDWLIYKKYGSNYPVDFDKKIILREIGAKPVKQSKKEIL